MCHKNISESLMCFFFTCVNVYRSFLHASKQILCVENCHRNSLVLPLGLNSLHQKEDLMSRPQLPTLRCSELHSHNR